MVCLRWESCPYLSVGVHQRYYRRTAPHTGHIRCAGWLSAGCCGQSRRQRASTGLSAGNTWLSADCGW